MTGELCIKEVDDDIELLWDTARCTKTCRSSGYDLKFHGTYCREEDRRDALVIHNNGHTCDKVTDGEYFVNITESCFEPSGKCLQLLLLLSDLDGKTVDFVYDEIQINSERFRTFAKMMYLSEYDKSVDFDVTRCEDFCGQMVIKKRKNKLFFDWDTIISEINPCSSGIDYHPINR